MTTQTGGWEKREPIQNMVFLGDQEGQRAKIGGLLIGIQKNRKYPDKDDYTIVLQSGEEVVLAGNATLSRQISHDDIGRFIKCEFKGWEKGGNGKFKVIEVLVWKGEINQAQLDWPRYREFQKLTAPAAKPPNGASPRPIEGQVVDEEAEDELPF